MDYKLLQYHDEDFAKLKKSIIFKKILKFISISENYFNFVTTNQGVHYYKIYYNNEIIGGLHLELIDNELHLMVFVDPLYQHQGFGTNAIEDVKRNKFKLSYNKIKVGIDQLLLD